jgi:hypothetical protein
VKNKNKKYVLCLLHGALYKAFLLVTQKMLWGKGFYCVVAYLRPFALSFFFVFNKKNRKEDRPNIAATWMLCGETKNALARALEAWFSIFYLFFFF